MIAELERAETSWIDDRVTTGKAYRYYITELDESGNESEPSGEVEVIPTDTIAPQRPGALEVRAERRGFSLSWQESPSPDVAGYLVYRAAYPGAPWLKLTRSLLQTASFSDRQGSDGNLYGVSAVDTSGNEGPMSTAVAEKGEDSR